MGNLAQSFGQSIGRSIFGGSQPSNPYANNPFSLDSSGGGGNDWMNSITNGTYGLNPQSPLVSILGGGRNQPMDEGRGPYGEYPGQAPQAPGPGNIQQAIPQAAQEVSQNTPDDNSPITIDAWKPHKRTTLGFIGDMLLSTLAHKPVTPFANAKNRENMQEVMEGFTQDPLTTIRRMAKINPEAAYKMYGQYVDDKRAQDIADRQMRVVDMRNDDYIFQQSAAVMSRATEKTWTAHRDIAIERARQRGGDSAAENVAGIIPEKYDPDSLESIFYGAIKPKDQMVEQGRDTRAANRITAQERGQDLAHGDRVRGQDIAHQDRMNKPQGKSGGEVTYQNSKYGPMAISPSGKTGMVKGPDGLVHVFTNTGPHQWKHVAVKKYAPNGKLVDVDTPTQ